jgi:hypothetical protein
MFDQFHQNHLRRVLTRRKRTATVDVAANIDKILNDPDAFESLQGQIANGADPTSAHPILDAIAAFIQSPAFAAIIAAILKAFGI